MRVLRWIGYFLVAVIVFGAVGSSAYVFTPWPKVFLIRHAFSKDAERHNHALEKHLRGEVTQRLDLRYGDGGSLDIYFPADADRGSDALPTLVWIHGGAFVAGDKSHGSNYYRIIAASGYTVVSVGYPLAPGSKYPAPVMAANEALAYLASHAAELHVDVNRLFLAGDSAGAQIAAQLAAVISDPAYAAAVGVDTAIERAQLRGAILFCGIYDTSLVKRGSSFEAFLETVMWSYFGTADAVEDPRLDQFSVGRHVTASFPPAFISVGNADPLAPQTVALKQAMEAEGVPVDALLFADDHAPPLDHEYQFNLDVAEGRQALQRMLDFLARLSN